MQNTIVKMKMFGNQQTDTFAVNAVDLLVNQAKSDRRGVYWSVAPIFKNLPSAQFDATLGAGTPGIVLALLEYYRVNQDPTIRELIIKAVGWLNVREKSREAALGFYFGDGGLWYLRSVLHEVLPELEPKHATDPVSSLGKTPASAGLAALSLGSAGTLLGALLASGGGESRNGSAPSHPLVSPLLQQVRFSPEGVFWDILPHTVRPPCGFLNGSAGIDYVFAGVKRIWREDYKELITSSVRHVNASFDGMAANWPDFEGTVLFRKLGENGIGRIIHSFKEQSVGEASKVENSLGWGSGTAGILLARAAVADCFPMHPLGATALDDCRRAVSRLEGATDAELGALEPYLQNGLTGIALAIKAYQASDAAVRFPISAKMESRILDLVAEKYATSDTGDLSLLTGFAGLAYTMLKLGSCAPADSCVNPLARISSAPAHASDRKLVMQEVIQRRLPRVAALGQGRNEFGSVELSLASIEQATAGYRSEHASKLEVKAANYELELNRQLVETPSFRYRMFRENYKQMRFSQSYGEGMNDGLLTERFRLDHDVSLLELEFDPGDPAPEIKAQKTILIRHRRSHGISDAKLSMLQYALLDQFRTPAVVIEAICNVIEKVLTPNVTQRQLAELSLKMVRSFVAAGYLFPDTPGKIRSLLIRRHFRRAKMNLFPVEVNR